MSDSGLIDTYRRSFFDGPRITPEWVRDRLSEGRRVFGRLWQQCDEMDVLANAEFDIDVPEGLQRLRLPTLYASLQETVRHLSSGRVDITVPERTAKNKDGGETERMERFLENAHAGLEVHYPAFEENLFQLGKYAIGIKKLEVNNESMHRLPSYDGYTGSRAEFESQLKSIMESRLSIFPFLQRVVDPRDVVWDYASKMMPRWLIWTHEVDAAWLKAVCPRWPGIGLGRGYGDSGSGAGYVRLSEIWTPTQVAFWVEEDDRFALPPQRHPYGSIPFMVYRTVNNNAGRMKTPDREFMPHGKPLAELIRHESQLVSAWMNIVYKSSTPQLIASGHAEAVQDFIDKYDNQPGTVLGKRNEVDVEWLTPDGAPPQVEYLASVMQRFQQQILFSTIQGTEAGRNASSGHQLAVLNNMQGIHLVGLKRAMERGMYFQNQHLLKCVEKVLPGPVSVFGTSQRGKEVAWLGKSHISGHYYTESRIHADTPDEQDRKWRSAAMAQQAGMLSKVDALRMAGYPQPQETFDAWFEEQVVLEQIPMLAQKMTERLMQEAQDYGTAGDQEAADLAEGRAEAISRLVGQGPAPGGTGIGMPRANSGTFGPGNAQGAAPPSAAGAEPSVPGSADALELLNRQRAVNPAVGNRLPVR